MTISEFGRTFRENGDRGTDHGHGSAYWVLGGGINGGRILGEQVKVEQPNLFQNRDYPVLTDATADLLAGGYRGNRMYQAAVAPASSGYSPRRVRPISASSRPAENPVRASC